MHVLPVAASTVSGTEDAASLGSGSSGQLLRPGNTNPTSAVVVEVGAEDGFTISFGSPESSLVDVEHDSP